MAYIFINLKRFDVPIEKGGICPDGDPERWIREVIRETVALGLLNLNKITLAYLLPEGLLLPALAELRQTDKNGARLVEIGCQGVHREDLEPGGNFGAFTTSLPASAAFNLGARWAIIGHSEERNNILSILTAYDPGISDMSQSRDRALATVSSIVNKEVLSALKAGIDVLFCMGETLTERGDGSFQEQKPRIERALRKQIEIGLSSVKDYIGHRRVVIGYEPIWAIGPGKIPPGPEYIDFVAGTIKELTQLAHGFTPPVVYGDGLKEENAESIGGIAALDGGLVALTKFTPPIGFQTSDLKIIVEKYMAVESKR